MDDQFARAVLLYGREGIESLNRCRVAVFGIGGVGGHCAEALCRSGVGAIDVFDADVVDITNINRQLIATHKVIGRSKVDVMSERLLDINPDVRVNARRLFYLPESADDVDLSVYDYVVDAIDTITAKIELVSRAYALGVPVISSMGAANKLDPTALEVADLFSTSVCPLARIMRRELRKRGIPCLRVVYSREVPVKRGDDAESEEPSPCLVRPIPGSNAFVPPVAGLILASEVVKGLFEKNLQT